jgi:hypothetical protein
MYLLSAGCMAVGARLYLVSPDSYAGEIGLILITLGVLQAYEWAVMTILLLLHRSRRSPEDKRSLLLVAALFWTGPIAATIELTAVQVRVGMLLAVGVLIFALLELLVVRRSLALRLSLAGRVLAAGCLLLLVLAPLELRIENADATNELFLYLCWWLLASVALLAIGCVRWHAAQASPAVPETRLPDGARHLRMELAFLAIVLAATATHLVAMNYAFCGHARAFYGAPLLVAVTVVALDYLARVGDKRASLRALVAVVPLVAIGLATQPFDREVPVQGLPALLRDPLLTALALATAAWWFGALRHKSAGLFHLGSLGLACTGLRAGAGLLPAGGIPTAPATHGLSSRDLAVIALFALTVYLIIAACIRRSRAEAVLALVMLQVAVVGAVWERTHAATLIIASVACWSLLVAAHLGERRPKLSAVLWPVAVLTGLAWFYDFDDALRWPARLESLGVVAALLVVGQLWPATRYRRVAAGVAAAHGLFLAGRGVAAAALPVATLIVGGSFVLLAIGAAISWHKRLLLRIAPGPEPAAPAEPSM